MYKPTHTNHPYALWVQESFSNYDWLHTVLGQYLIEYRQRSGKGHKTEGVYLSLSIGRYSDSLSFPNCTPYPDMDTHTAYRVLLREKWAADAEKGRPPKWTNRGAPSWAPEWADSLVNPLT